MRILYIVSTPSWSGSNVALYNLIKELHVRHEIQVVFPCKESVFQSRLDDLGIIHHTLDFYVNVYPKSRNPFSWMKLFWKTIKANQSAKKEIHQIITVFKPNIVHNNVGPIDISFDACFQQNIPHLWHLREYQDLDFNITFIPSKAYFMRKIHQRGNYNIAITHGVFNHWKLRNDIDRVIYDGVFDYKNIVNLSSSDKENYFLFVGRVQEGKGTLEAIKAFTLFQKGNKGAYRLLIAGTYWPSGKYFQQCQKLIRKNKLGDKVEFLGERSDVYLLMQRAIAILVPSFFEGFGFITVEAMLNRCPVIGRNTGGTKEQFDNGLRLTGHEIGFRFNTVQEMASHMATILITDTSEMRKYAFETVSSNYSQQIHARCIEEYYQWILLSEHRNSGK